MIGSLLYLIVSRPNIIYNMCLCACFQFDPGVSHFKVVKHIFRYLTRITNLSLFYEKNKDFRLVGYCDVEYVGDRVERKITSE
uniref:Retrovirus-related Pol polyprotein from transposon TNT 1-94 n=1 Tax=Cajanus cajan TaxID=3821 RepID=A0A151RH51_CAJCA|nr:hypothetical protein KK1_036782 [Cajanus cajan]